MRKVSEAVSMSAMRHKTKFGFHSVASRTTPIHTVLIHVAVVLCTLSLTIFTLQPAAAQDAGLSPQAQQILDAVNQARIDNGLPPLAASPLLNLAAQRHVDDVVANGNWGHYGSDGSNVQMRAARAGYATSSVSENWVAVSDPGQAIGWWMNDWIHRVNILEPRWDEIGVGAAQAGNGYWILVTDFGNIDGGAMPPISDSAPVTQLTAADDIAGEAIPDNGEYAIQSGDTLLGIAIRYGLDWQDIALANDMRENELLQIGRVIRLPNPNGGGGTGGAVTAGGAVAGKKTHVVRTGETLWTISARYQIPWEDLAAVNGLGEYDLLQIEQELKLPASLDEPEETQPAADASDSAESASAADDSGDQQTVSLITTEESGQAAGFRSKKATDTNNYTVKSGDTLLGIALSLGTEWEDLAAANDLTEDSYLQIGQDLRLPGAGPVQATGSETKAKDAGGFAAGSATAPRVHRVQPGDTVYGIALEYNVDWQELLRANKLTEESLLQPDQELLLP